MTVRIILIMLICGVCLSCKTSFEQKYYERISGMNFPDKFRVIETFDNGEYVTTTTLQAASADLIYFKNNYHFEQAMAFNPTQFLGKNYLKKQLPDFRNTSDLYIKTGSNGKNSWIYIIDIDRNLLWAEIQYPDWGGH